MKVEARNDGMFEIQVREGTPRHVLTRDKALWLAVGILGLCDRSGEEITTAEECGRREGFAGGWQEGYEQAVTDEVGDLLGSIATEMKAQLHQWGEQDHSDPVWLTILMEEVGEVCKAELQGGDVESELVQVAAVAASWLESHRRKHRQRGEER